MKICLAQGCDRNIRHPKKGLCNRCYQRIRSKDPAEKARQAASSKRWYVRNNGRERGVESARKFRIANPLWNIFQGVRRRTAETPDGSTKHWAHYGGRGIRMHGAWKNDFKLFVQDIERECGTRPSAKHSLDRINNDGNYEPGNLRWATGREQRSNTREAIALRERDEIYRRLATIEALIDDALQGASA